MDVSDKVVVITGASAGIGLVTARRFASAGAKVVLVARSTDKLTALAEELRSQGHKALPITTDMRDKGAVTRMIEQALQHYGKIDILINNAGQAAAGAVAEVDSDDFRKILELNVFGALYAMQAVVPKMRKAGGGFDHQYQLDGDKNAHSWTGGLCGHQDSLEYALGNGTGRIGIRQYPCDHCVSPAHGH